MDTSGFRQPNISKQIFTLSERIAHRANTPLTRAPDPAPQVPQLPQLLPAGPEKMIARARTNGLIVPLSKYALSAHRPRGLSPQAWNTFKAFWVLYFREAWAELVSYSTECGVEWE